MQLKTIHMELKTNKIPIEQMKIFVQVAQHKSRSITQIWQTG